MSLEQVRPYAQNAKAHPPSQVAKIARTISEYGWDQPIVVDADLLIIKGHERFLAAQELGLETLPVVVAAHLSPEQVRAACLADNKVAESDWLPEFLGIELKALKDLDFDLDLTWFL
jgi:ParB-like chromosome segregation protein Spo0J